MHDRDACPICAKAPAWNNASPEQRTRAQIAHGEVMAFEQELAKKQKTVDLITRRVELSRKNMLRALGVVVEEKEPTPSVDAWDRGGGK
jgi:hypothetical protein